ATYGLRRWTSAQSAQVARTRSTLAFHQLVTRTRVGRPSDAVSLEVPAPDSPVFPPAGDEISFQQEGDIWRIAYAGTTVTLRHSRGLALLVHLLRNAGQMIHVATLDAITPAGGAVVASKAPAPEGGVAPPLGDAGEILDDRARTEYRRRLADLRDE